MSKQKTYRVTFSEWVLYQDTVEATSPVEAARKVYQRFLEEGPDDFKIRNNGTEGWMAEAPDGTETEISDSELVEV
jgi:hypothetical protein